ncbi:MAG: solute carrier family 23 protein [Syntrophales bacterium]|nr:solute carrier family 23 protein [Syntrophales bacterium]
MDKKPDHIVYGVDEKPPLKYLLVLSFQHALIPMMFLTFPILVIRELDLSFASSVDYLSACILTLGVGTIIQCSRNAIGSGTLAVHQSTPIFLPAFLLAAKTGGLGAAWFLTFLAGVLQIGLSRVLIYLKKIFTEEVCGVAIFMLGLSMVPSAIRMFFGLDRLGSSFLPVNTLVAFVTLLSIVVTSAFFKKNVRFYSLVIGCGCGYLLSWPLDCFPPDAKGHLLMSPWISMPHISLPVISFRPELFLIFMSCAIISSIDTLGGMITIDKMNHAEWEKQDIRISVKGVRADGFNNLISGLLGAYPNGVSSSNIGLSFATAVTSRYVGIGAGMMITVLAFFPKLLALLSIIPEPVTGAILMYAAAFLICTGIELIMLRSLNTSKIYIVGFSIIGGIACGQFAHFTDQMPSWLRLAFSSQLIVATMLAISLTLFFRAGQKNIITFRFVTNESFDAKKVLESFIARVPLKSGVFNSAYKALNECVEAIIMMNPGKAVSGEIACSYNNSVLRLAIRYPGAPLDTTPQRPDISNLDNPANAAQLEVFLMAHYANRVQVESDKGYSTVSLFFEE